MAPEDEDDMAGDGAADEGTTDDTSNPSEGGSDDSSRFHRRGFFREGFRQFFRPLADAVADTVQERLDRVGLPREEDWSDVPGGGGPPPYVPTSEPPADGTVLRPPGALEEHDFLDRCLSSGHCVNACPVSAIKMGRSDDPREDEKPFIDPESQACVVCDELSCMNVCPSGALLPVPKEEIRMGMAIVETDVCLRSSGEDCQICVDKCPLGAVAISIPYEGATIHVHDPGCTGCGVCQMYCPTEPRAIRIEPDSERNRLPGDRPSDGGSYFPVADDDPEYGND